MICNDSLVAQKGSIVTMAAKKHWFPFTAEQTVNILSEFGPLVTMFVVNAVGGIKAGTWALIISTAIAMVGMRVIIGRLPIFPIIASTITIIFGALTIVTGDPIWVKIKVSIFNALFAGFLFGGLWATSAIMGRASWKAVVSVTAATLLAQVPYFDFSQGFNGLMLDMPPIGDEGNPLTTNLVCLSTLVIGFILGGFIFKRNFFSYVFEKTFHFTTEGWDRFTFSFAWFFVLTAVLNEAVRQIFVDSRTYPVFGHELDGTSIWILFKVALIMPLSGLYAWFLTRLMHKYRIEEPETTHPKVAEPVPAAAAPARVRSR
jgi:intracellular septation protein